MKKKFIYLASVFSLIASTASAQLKGFSFGPYLEAAWPKGDFLQTNRNGLGLGLAADMKLGGKLAAMGSAGYMHFGNRSSNDNTVDETVNAVPVRVGIKYRLPLVYVKLESGVAKFSDGRENPLILSPGIGVRLLGLDVQASYETWLSKNGRSFAALRMGYHF